MGNGGRGRELRVRLSMKISLQSAGAGEVCSDDRLPDICNDKHKLKPALQSQADS